MLSWWEVAANWREQEARVPRGRVEHDVGAFARSLGVTALTVRRAAAALRFAERLHQEGRIKDPSDLRAVPISFLLLLQRLDRFAPGEVDRLMPDLLRRGVGGRTLREVEKKVRAEAEAGRVRAVPADGHLRRMGAPAFLKRALAALSLPTSPLKGRVVLSDPRGPGLGSPVPLHAVVVDDAGADGEENRHGVRVFPASMDAPDARRVQGAFQMGLATARVFDSFFLLFEDRGEASELVSLLGEAGPTGVGVLWLAGDGQLTVEHEPVREAGPDLAHSPWGKGLRTGSSPSR